jgi:hypothetical protein
VGVAVQMRDSGLRNIKGPANIEKSQKFNHIIYCKILKEFLLGSFKQNGEEGELLYTFFHFSLFSKSQSTIGSRPNG